MHRKKIAKNLQMMMRCDQVSGVESCKYNLAERINPAARFIWGALSSNSRRIFLAWRVCLTTSSWGILLIVLAVQFDGILRAWFLVWGNRWSTAVSGSQIPSHRPSHYLETRTSRMFTRTVPAIGPNIAQWPPPHSRWWPGVGSDADCTQFFIAAHWIKSFSYFG